MKREAFKQNKKVIALIAIFIVTLLVNVFVVVLAKANSSIINIEGANVLALGAGDVTDGENTSGIALAALTDAEKEAELHKTPADNEYLELKMKEIVERADGTKQVMMELRGHNIQFEGFDVRFSYDAAHIKPSTLESNDSTMDIMDLPYDGFKFETEFDGPLDLFTIPDGENIIRGICSFLPPNEETEHIKEVKPGCMAVVTGEDLLLGTMSFKMEQDEEFDISWFKLERGDKDPNDISSPVTGIDVIIRPSEVVDGEYEYYDQESVFRFTMDDLDLSLEKLEVSRDEENEEDPENPIHKVYDLNPSFDKEEKNYEITIREYIDDVDLTIKKASDKAKSKVRVPKRDEDGNLVYDGTDNTKIVYEEKPIEDDVKLNITLNKLGEPDTVITVVVMSEDGTETNEYEVVIKRPCGKIIGSVYTAATAYKETYHATIRAFSTEQVKELVDWDEAVGKGDKAHDTLIDNLKSQNKDTKDDGTFEIYLLAGNVDIMMDKPGYLDEIFVNKEVKEGETIDLGRITLYEGDLNKDGQIEIIDLSMIIEKYDIDETQEGYESKYDFNEDGYIELIDMTYVITNYDRVRNINM